MRRTARRATARACLRVRLLRLLGLLHADQALLKNGTCLASCLRETAFRDPRSYFTKYADIDDQEAERGRARHLDPHQPEEPAGQRAADAERASLILTKGASHRIEEVALRKL